MTITEEADLMAHRGYIAWKRWWATLTWRERAALQAELDQRSATVRAEMPGYSMCWVPVEDYRRRSR